MFALLKFPQEARFLISQQKYLELLEAQSVNAALHVLRNELASLNIDVDDLHSLSRYKCLRAIAADKS